MVRNGEDSSHCYSNMAGYQSSRKAAQSKSRKSLESRTRQILEPNTTTEDQVVEHRREVTATFVKDC